MVYMRPDFTFSMDLLTKSRNGIGMPHRKVVKIKLLMYIKETRFYFMCCQHSDLELEGYSNILSRSDLNKENSYPSMC